MRRIARAGTALALAAACRGLALAHGDPSPYVRAVLEPGELPPALAGMRVEVHRTIAPQIVVANPTGRTLEVLDAGGTPFLRLGPRGVEGNAGARAWYATFAPGAQVPAADGPPRWVTVATRPAFGWFDPRLESSDVAVSHRVADAGLSADVGRWRIPVRVDGRAADIAGRFRWEPPRDVAAPRLTSPPEIAPGVRVRLLPGRVPGLLLASTRSDGVVVLGADGEPFLRFTPGGVDGNSCSATFRAAVRGAVAAPEAEGCAGASPRWRRVAASPRFAWVEPRAGPAGTRVPADAAAPAKGGVHRWRVPIRVGEEALELTGTTHF